ncbi:hypothetical protein BRD02_10745 [Halobacteriales archaeon QS_8_69_73]|nr:MAG: hypothetical protein BRD02_10745 [Halobacteriales archaeon QS_8_69_73]
MAVDFSIRPLSTGVEFFFDFQMQFHMVILCCFLLIYYSIIRLIKGPAHVVVGISPLIGVHCALEFIYRGELE